MHTLGLVPEYVVPLTCTTVVLVVIALAFLSGRRQKAAPEAHTEGSDLELAPEPVEAHEGVALASGIVPKGDLPRIAYDEDADIEATRLGDHRTFGPAVLPVLYDDDAQVDEPTAKDVLILTSAYAQTDRGKRRKENEDSLLVSEKHSLYIVADGMGGHRGGDVASRLAIDSIAKAFDENEFTVGAPAVALPRRGSELAGAIQFANRRVLERSKSEKQFEGMGTTVSAARFSPHKQRLYIGHVGDSRVYRLRDGKLEQLTTDHTMQSLGIGGTQAAFLSRAVGVGSTVSVDLVIAKPLPGDVYLLCSDGLTKMVSHDAIAATLRDRTEPNDAVKDLVNAANESGGEDNVTVIVVRVSAPRTTKRVA